MKYTLSFATFLMAGIMTLASAQTQSWQGMHKVPASQAESNFANPPQEFASHVIWGWEGDMDLATIQHDLDSSNDILLTNTYIYCHDDCLSIKSGKDTEGRRIGRPAENIRVENCHFAYGHGGVDIGSEVSGSVRNVHAINCTFDDGNWGSIRIKSQPARGGVIENITFENFTVKGSSTIIDVNLDWTGGNKSEVPGYSDPVTQLRNIRIINCHGFGERLGQIRGFDCDPFKSDAFYFENNSFEVQSGMNIKNTENVDFNGLEAKVVEGPVFFKDGEFTPKPLVHRGSMNNLPQEGTRPLKK